MQLFKNEFLNDTSFAVIDLEFHTQAYGPRYGRRSNAPRAFALSSARLGDFDDEAASLDWCSLERELQAS